MVAEVLLDFKVVKAVGNALSFQVTHLEVRFDLVVALRLNDLDQQTDEEVNDSLKPK